MVDGTQAAAQSPAVRQRARRQREEEVLVWPDLVFIEFIAALLFTLSFTVLSILINAPLQDRANPANTPNPSKAPWYFLNLQELLLHMHPALAGVVVPGVAIAALAAIPYFDRNNEGQGVYLSTDRAWPLLWIGTAVGTVGTVLLILWDGAKHVVLYERLTGSQWPQVLDWMGGARALQAPPTGHIAWPEWMQSIPLGSKVLRTDLLGLPAVDLDVNLPAVFVEQLLPTALMIGLPVLMSVALWRTGLAKTRRDHMIAQFAGFIAVYVVLTVIGTAFRGHGMELLPPWEVEPPVS